jgi:predicted nucleic acid-binding Zn ribbon protein
MSAPAEKRCPECKGLVRRLIGGGAGLIFKGSGFYETDYKRKPAGKVTDASCEKPACKKKSGSSNT